MVLSKPEFKVTVTHSAVATDYISDVFPQIEVTRRENNYDTAILTASNYKSGFYPNKIDTWDTVDIYVRNAGGAYTLIFSGTVRQVDPSISPHHAKIYCRGLGHALFATNCNADFGSQSSHSAYYYPEDIFIELVDNYINRSFTGANTGYAIGHVNITDFNNPLITYLPSPYKTNGDLINTIMQIQSAYRNGSAGPHWIVDTSGELRVKYINTSQVGWTEYWQDSATLATLVEDVDFQSYTMFKKTEEFANKVVLCADLRKPGYDYYTESGAGLWTHDATIEVANGAGAGNFVVGANSLRLNCVTDVGHAWYPVGKDLAWDITKWGSVRSIPTVNFYARTDGVVGGGGATLLFFYVELFTTDENADFYYYDVTPDLAVVNKWYHFSFPIGDYYDKKEDKANFKWSISGTPNWNNINGIAFYISADTVAPIYVWVDDLHFTGKIVREAYNSTSITARKENQIILYSPSALDDSGKQSDESGAAARLAYGELLRRQKLPRTMIFTVEMKVDLLAGQKVHIHAAKDSGGSFNINDDFRVVEVKHSISAQGFNSTIICTDDVLNSFPTTGVIQKDIMNEYLLVNNVEAKNTKSGIVDTLISKLSVDHP